MGIAAGGRYEYQHDVTLTPFLTERKRIKEKEEMLKIQFEEDKRKEIEQVKRAEEERRQELQRREEQEREGASRTHLALICTARKREAEYEEAKKRKKEEEEAARMEAERQREEQENKRREKQQRKEEKRQKEEEQRRREMEKLQEERAALEKKIEQHQQQQPPPQQQQPQQQQQKKPEVTREAPQEVKDFLSSINALEHLDAFISNGFDSMDVIAALEDQDFQVMNTIPAGHRKKILNAVAKLKKSAAIVSPTPIVTTTAVIPPARTESKQTTDKEHREVPSNVTPKQSEAKPEPSETSLPADKPQTQKRVLPKPVVPTQQKESPEVAKPEPAQQEMKPTPAPQKSQVPPKPRPTPPPKARDTPPQPSENEEQRESQQPPQQPLQQPLQHEPKVEPVVKPSLPSTTKVESKPVAEDKRPEETKTSRFEKEPESHHDVKKGAAPREVDTALDKDPHCPECGKVVYLTDRVVVDSLTLHKFCFKCTHCKGKQMKYRCLIVS